jgi:hypothetical protein
VKQEAHAAKHRFFRHASTPIENLADALGERKAVSHGAPGHSAKK